MEKNCHCTFFLIEKSSSDCFERFILTESLLIMEWFLLKLRESLNNCRHFEKNQNWLFTFLEKMSAVCFHFCKMTDIVMTAVCLYFEKNRIGYLHFWKNVNCFHFCKNDSCLFTMCKLDTSHVTCLKRL